MPRKLTVTARTIFSPPHKAQMVSEGELLISGKASRHRGGGGGEGASDSSSCERMRSACLHFRVNACAVHAYSLYRKHGDECARRLRVRILSFATKMVPSQTRCAPASVVCTCGVTRESGDQYQPRLIPTLARIRKP